MTTLKEREKNTLNHALCYIETMFMECRAARFLQKINLTHKIKINLIMENLQKTFTALITINNFLHVLKLKEEVIYDPILSCDTVNHYTNTMHPLSQCFT